MARNALLTAAIALTLASAAAMPAAARLSPNGQMVRGDGSEFTVTYKPGLRLSDYWCAAGDFVISGLHALPNTPIWRISAERPQPGGGMTFSLSPAQSVGKTGLVVLGRDDGALSAGMAEQMCENRRRSR